MKKLVTVLLIAVMVFGLATSAFAYTDTKDLDAKIQDAITKLSALDVVNGYPDGSFGVNKDISRSEFAKVACNLAGLGDAADNLKGTKSRFKDVPANQWYTGWVNLATAQGFVNGYPDGTFKPNAPITMQEVVTVLLRIAGYDDNLPGPWPFDYIAQASKVDVTKDIKFVSSGKSTRGDVASMGSNLLDVKAVYWNSDKAKFENIDDKKDLTVLEDSFGAVVEAGYVDGITKATTENEKFALKKESAWTVENFAKDVLALNLDAKSYDLAKTYAFETGYNLSNIAGHQVKVILNDDKDIVYVDVKSSIVKGDKATIDGSKIKIGGRSYAVVAFDVNDKADGMGNYINTYEAKDNNVEAYAYLNNDDQVYAVVSDKKVTINSDKNTLVDSVDVEKGRIEAIMGSTFSNLTKDDVYVIKDGVKASLKDIKQFDLIQSLKDTGDADKILLVQTPVTGKLTRVYGNTHATLANTKYPVASPHYFVEDADTTDVALADYLGKDVNYVLNGANEILAVVAGEGASASKWNYGVVTDLTLKQERDAAGFGMKDTEAVKALTVYTTEGKEVKFNVDKDTYQVDAKGDPSITTVDKGVVIDYGQIVKFRVDKDNMITKGADITITAVSDKAIKGDKDRERLTVDGKTYFVGKDVAAFTWDLKTDKVDLDENPSLLTQADLLKMDATKTAWVYEESGDVKAILVGNFSTTAKYGVVEAQGYNTSALDNVVKFWANDTEYEQAGTKAVVDNLYQYTVSGTKATLGTAIATKDNAGKYTFAGTIKGEIDSLKNGVLGVKGHDTYTIETDTVIIDMTGDPVYAKEGDLYKGLTVGVVLGNKNEIALVVIFDAADLN